MKKQSVKAVANLMAVGRHFKLAEGVCKKTLRVMLDMVHCSDDINA